MIEFFVGVLLATAVGITTAGLGASAYAIFADRRLSFEATETGSPLILPRALLLLLSGPMILATNLTEAVRSRPVPVGPAALSALVALGWSFCTGLAILNLAILLRGV